MGHQVTIDVAHARIHQGERFAFTTYTASVANNGTSDILIITGASVSVHLAVEASASGLCHVALYEHATAATTNALGWTVNRNRVSTTTCQSRAYSAATITSVGSVLFQKLLPGGGTPGNATGGHAESFAEFVLARNRNYLVRLTNISGGAASADVSAHFYEVP
jgi:hypothetical protein